MNGYLLDTHILIWWLEDDFRLKPSVKSLLSDSVQPIYVSHATAWELIIKKSLGKLDAPDDLSTAVSYYNFIWLPIKLTHIEAILALPLHHSDPFDRMLIAQSKIEELTLISHDRRMNDYEIALVQA